MQALQAVMTTKRSYFYSFFYIFVAGPFRSGKSNNVVLINKKEESLKKEIKGGGKTTEK